MEKLKQNPIVKKLGLNRIMLVCILVLMFVVFKVVLGSKFPVGDSIKSTLNYVYFLGFLSLGVTFVIPPVAITNVSTRPYLPLYFCFFP